MYNIEVLSSAWHAISAFLIFLIGFFLSLKLALLLRINQRVTLFLYLYHSIFSLVYLYFILSNGGDAIGYYTKGELSLPPFLPGTIAVIYISRFLHMMDLSILGFFLFFNIFGSIGLFFVYSSLNSVVKYSSVRLKGLTFLFLFLPSVSFWSAGLGKDAISFMAVGIALYSALQFNKRFILMILAVALMLFVRPHMAGIMVMAIVFSTTTSKNIPIIPRLIIGCAGLVTALVMIPFALEYAGVENDASNLESYIETRQGYNQHGGGSVDIASMTLPMQLFTYTFRPLPFEVSSITQLFASLDNILLLFIFFWAIKVKLTVKNIQFSGNRAFMWFYVGVSWTILSMTTANLGIAMRQKWMFVPILIYLLISILAEKESRSFK